MTANHDHHFLTRLERLEGPHAELALTLYYDSSLVKYVLSQVELPDAAERVALSLDDPEEGPFIIVARDGGFVTCLGAGMRIGNDEPVVTRQRLDSIAGRMGALRRAMDEAESGMTRCRHLVKKVLEVGDRLTREEFEQLARLTPLLQGHYFRALIGSMNDSLDTYARLERARRLTAPRHEKVLRRYWTSSWSMAHFSLLLAADGPHVLGEVFEALETLAPEYKGGRARLLPWALSRLGVTSFVARGSFVASKASRVLLPDLKQSWLEHLSANGVLSYGLGLAAVGLRHRRFRAEVRKVLARSGQPKDSEYTTAFRKLVAAGYEDGVERFDELRDALPSLARTLLDGLGEQQGPGEMEYIRQVPNEVAASYLLTLPMGVHSSTKSVLHMLQWLPWLVEAEATDFYLPAAFTGLRRERWTPAEAIALIEPRREFYHPGGVSSVATGKPLRKRPCPCGSGKKYKRCCGAGETDDADEAEADDAEADA